MVLSKAMVPSRAQGHGIGSSTLTLCWEFRFPWCKVLGGHVEEISQSKLFLLHAKKIIFLVVESQGRIREKYEEKLRKEYQ